MEIVNLTFFAVYFGLIVTAELVLQAEQETDNFDITSIGLIRQTADSVLAINMVISVLKIFKYIKVSRRMNLMLNTFYDARWALFALLILVVVFLVGFAMAFFVAFGHRIKGFRNFARSFVTLFNAMLDGYDEAQELERVHWLLGPGLYLFFQVFISFVLLSLLIAIIEDSFQQAQQEMLGNKDKVSARAIHVF